MEVPNGDAAIVPYLNPEYWDDHSIGYCDHASDPMSPPLRTGGVERRARRLLEGQLTTGRMFPHETYMNGQVFSPVAYELGTVVLCRQEQLYGSAPLAPDPRFVAGNTLPNRPTDILPKFASEQSQSAFIGSHDRAMYASQALWGIVAENRQQRKALYTVMAALVDRAGDGKVMAGVWSLDEAYAPLEIGATRHVIGPHKEALSRVNALQVMTYGSRPRKGKRIFDLLGVALPQTT